MIWFIDDLNEYQIYITNLWQEFTIPKFDNLEMTVDEPYLNIYWTDFQEGGGAKIRHLQIDYMDVVDGYSGYADNPGSAADLKTMIDAMIVSGFGGSTPGDLLTAKADLLSHDGVSDTILPGGTNEYILSRNDVEQTGLEWIPKTDIYSDELAQDAVGSILDTDEFTYNDGAPSIALKNVFSYVIGYTSNVDSTNTTSEEVLWSCLIPAGTLSVGDSIRVPFGLRKSSGAGNWTASVRLHTAATVPGGTSFYTVGFSGAVSQTNQIHMVMTGASAQRGTPNSGLSYGQIGADSQTAALNIANNIYVNFVSQKVTGTDGTHLRWAQVIIEKYRT